MSEFFVGQVMMTGFVFAPKYFAQCNGQLLPIAQNQALFSLLGTQYGGNGSTNFALPDLRGRTPIGFGNSVDPGWSPPPAGIGERGGVENVTLLPAQMPSHTHALQARTATGTTRIPKGNALATSASTALYATGSPNVALAPQSISSAGNTQPHPNMQPSTTLNFCIALQGIFPSRN
ncbi:tail fiber protein [Comamonas sp. MYb21]|uniref:phage tail protein n=1 Tax=unclassified Comamonas TaxID=2638500 RepID=UPI000412DCC7|nr:tail fiber protein [Comamonas sp. B-9]